MTTEERLLKLEQEVIRTKRLNRLMSLLFIGVCIILWFSCSNFQNGVIDEVRARKITVVDEEGINRIVLVADEKWVGITLIDKNNTPRIFLGGDEETQSLSLYDESETKRIVLGSTEGRQGLNLYDENDALRGCLLSMEKRTELTFYDEKDTPRVFLSHIDDKQGLSLFDKNNTNRVELISNLEVESLTLNDAIRPRIMLSSFSVGATLFNLIGKDGSPSIQLHEGYDFMGIGNVGIFMLDENNSVIWSAP